jgi:hypothetical protein
MKSGFRPSTPADASALVALFAELGLYANVDTDYLNWKYWQPCADWAGSRSFVLATGDDVLAHGAVVPGVCAWGSQRVTLLQIVDWAARANPGAGVTLLKHIGRMTEALLGIGGREETQRLLPIIGFRPAGTATAYALPLFPLRILRGKATWKLLPRLARGIWRHAALPEPDAQWRTRRLAADEVGQITSVLPRPVRGAAIMERSVGLFRHMLSCPTVPMQLHAVERAGRVCGYFLLASALGQVRIADCWMDSEELADWGALILCAVAEARHDPQAAEIVTWSSDALLAGGLRSCGFHARFDMPICVRPSITDAMPQGTLRIQMLDSDAAYLSEGSRDYWG